MQKIDLKQGFPTSSNPAERGRGHAPMQNPRSFSDLLSRTGNKLSALKRRSEERIRIAELVRLSLPTRLAGAVMGAELVDGRLVVAISGAAWASRVRYHVDALRKEVGAATGSSITGVRVKVVPTP